MIYERYVYEQREEPIVYMSERDIDIAPGARFGPVIRDLYVLECCTDGYGSVIVNGREFPVEPGCCFFLLPGDEVSYKTGTEQPRSDIWCAFDCLQAGRILAQAGITSQNPYAPRELFDEIMQQVEQLVRMKGEPDPGADLRRASHIYAVLGALLRFAPSAANKNLWVQKAVGIIETQYHKHISVKEIADAVGLDRSYFSTLFREQTGMTPHAYLNTLRIKKACTLMEQHKLTIAAVAEEVGLDYRNFARIFKKVTGNTPGEYNKNYLLNTERR